MDRVISVVAIGGLIFVVVLGIFRGWLIRAIAPVLRLVVPSVIAAVVVIAIGIPVLIGANYLTEDGALMLGITWAYGFPLLLPVNVAALVIASHLQRTVARLLVIALGTGWWALFPREETIHEEVVQDLWIGLHAVLVAAAWEVMFRLRDRPRAGVPGRGLSFLRIEDVPPADQATDPDWPDRATEVEDAS